MSSVGPALLLNDHVLGMSKIKVTHAIQVSKLEIFAPSPKMLEKTK
jgi:hypothetical protein